MLAVLAFFLALFTTAIVIHPLIMVAKRHRLLDEPGGRKAHERSVPRLGGAAMAVGAILPLVLWMDFAPPFKALAIGIGAMSAVGLLDDLITLDWKVKFLVQLVAASFAVLVGGIAIVNLGMWWGHEVILSSWISTPLTIFFIVGVTNAINLTDGLDGLAGGLALFAYGLLLFFALSQGLTAHVIPIAAFAGAVCGFLRYNTHPAIIFMGDAGSYLIGFSTAVLTVMCTQVPGSPLAPTVALLVLWIPIVDTLVVMTQRLAAGLSPFHPDRRHIHYRLMELGCSHRKAVILIYIAQALVAFTAVHLAHGQDSSILFVFLSLAAAIILGLVVARRKRVHLAGFLYPSGLVSASTMKKWQGWVGAVSREALSAVVVIFFVGFPLLPGEGLSSWGLIAAWIPAALPGAYFLRPGIFRPVTRISLYLLTALLANSVFLDVAPYLSERFESALLVLAISLGVLVALSMRYSASGVLGVSPMDVLLALVVAALPFLPVSDERFQAMAFMASFMVVFFLAVEVIVGEGDRRWRAVHSAACVSGAVLALRAFLA